MGSWYLEGFFGANGGLQKLPLKNFPQTLGRDQSLTYSIPYPSVSRKHAIVEERAEQLCITDLNSSNGTYVNRERITRPTLINHGDVIHFGNLELRFLQQGHSHTQEVVEPAGSQTLFINKAELSETFPAGVRELEALIEARAIAPVFQPILQADGLKKVGYEVLGRGASDKISASPLVLFNIAESVGLEVQLSDLMRTSGVDSAVKYGLDGEIWINTHPSEIKQPDQLLSSLHALRQRHPKVPLVFEVHEQCVADVDFLRSFKEELRKLNMRFAFDDFGVGQSRLMEVVEAKPDIIKFDKVLIAGIDQADPGRVNLLRHLQEIASELGIQTLAECVENRAEYQELDKIGFDLYQGYYFCKPQPPESFTGTSINPRHQ